MQSLLRLLRNLGTQALTFGAMGATRMACPEGMDQEQELFTVLGSITRYEIHGSKLMLFADKALVARFEAQDAIAFARRCFSPTFAKP